jgi:drug/metabolite transporter (DMT)-like permease
VASGLLWGSTIPLSKVVLDDVGPAWLAAARFAVAGALLAGASRRTLRRALSWRVLGWGAAGYGAMMLLQNAGIERTSATHAALLVAATPVLVALLSMRRGRALLPPSVWAGLVLALAGVGLVATAGEGASTVAGDGLVLLAVACAAALAVAQPALLAGRDPVAVTAVQFLAAAAVSVPVALGTEGAPPSGAGAPALLAVLALAVVGTMLPFTLFAYAQGRVSPVVAGAFLNLEPLVGALVGVLVLGDPFGTPQAVGGAAVLAGIVLSTVRPVRPARPSPAAVGGAPAVPAPARPADDGELTRA